MDRRTLINENTALKRALKLAARKVEHNETVLRRFFDMELQLLSCCRLTELMELLLVSFPEHFRLSAVSLWLFDPEQVTAELLTDLPIAQQQQLRFHADIAPLQQLYPQGQPIVGEMSGQHCQQFFPDTPYVLSAALLPLFRHNCLIGSLHLGAQDLHRYRVDYRYDYLIHLASVIALCIENCINQETLQRLSTQDVLTGVHNRRAFNQDIVREITRASRTGQPLSCLLLDLDHFKQVNDHHGHLSGDQVLREVGRLLRQSLRKTDLVARFGGEEFAVLLPGCNQRQAQQVADNLRRQIGAAAFFSADQQPLSISASIGFTSLQLTDEMRPDLRTLSTTLLDLADQALYQAKRGGRNCVRFLPWSATEPAAAPDADWPVS